MQINNSPAFKGRAVITSWEPDPFSVNREKIIQKEIKTTPEQDYNLKIYSDTLRENPDLNAQLINEKFASRLLQKIQEELGVKLYDSQEPKALYTDFDKNHFKLSDTDNTKKGVSIHVYDLLA